MLHHSLGVSRHRSIGWRFVKVTKLFPSTEVLEHIAFRAAEGQLFREGGESALSLLLNIKQGDDLRCRGEGGEGPWEMHERWRGRPLEEMTQ